MNRKRTTIISIAGVGLAWLLTLGVHVDHSVDIHRDHYAQRSDDPNEVYFSFNVETRDKRMGIPFLLTISKYTEPFQFRIYADTQNKDIDAIIIDSATLQSDSMRNPQKLVEATACLSDERRKYQSERWVDYSAYWLKTDPKIQFTNSASVKIEYRLVFKDGVIENRFLNTDIRMKKDINVDTYWSGVGAAIGGV